jgi:RNA polymerase sigma factor (sigma-70 family)
MTDDPTALDRFADDGCPHAAPLPSRLTADERAAVLARWECYVWRLAIRWKRFYPMIDVDDLAAHVRTGFVIAANRFDVSRGNEFSTYATHWARNEVQAFVLREAASGIHVPNYRGITYVPMDSLSRPIERGGRGRREVMLGDTVPAREEPEPEPEFPADFWERATRVLDKRAALFLTLHFRDGLTYVEIGRRVGLSRERVRQILARSLERLREDDVGLRRVLAAA